jgi:hypothetical protein
MSLPGYRLDDVVLRAAEIESETQPLSWLEV